MTLDPYVQRIPQHVLNTNDTEFIQSYVYDNLWKEQVWRLFVQPEGDLSVLDEKIEDNATQISQLFQNIFTLFKERSFLDESIEDIGSKISQLFYHFYALTEISRSLKKDIEDKSTQIAQLDQKINSLKLLKPVVITENYTALPFDFIKASNNCMITFPKYPVEGDLFVIKNSDGRLIKLSGNGRKINGFMTGELRRKNTAIKFYYFLNSDSWEAV